MVGDLWELMGDGLGVRDWKWCLNLSSMLKQTKIEPNMEHDVQSYMSMKLYVTFSRFLSTYIYIISTYIYTHIVYIYMYSHINI